MTAREILDLGAERIETELRDQPVVRGRLLGLLGKVYDSLGEWDRAIPLLEEAVELGRTLRGEREDTADPSNLEVALCALGRTYGRQDRSDEAIALCREAVEVAAAAHGVESTPYAYCLNNLAFQLTRASAHDEARVAVERALELRREILGPKHEDVAWSFYQHAHLLRTIGELGRSREQYEKARAIWEEVLPENHPQIAMCLIDISLLLTDLEEYDAALECAERALEIREKTLGPEHPKVADTLNDIGFLHWRKGDLPGARRCFYEAVEVQRAARGPVDPMLLTRLYRVAFIASKMGRTDEEEAVLLDVLELARTHHADSPLVVAQALKKLGMHYGQRYRDNDARPYLEEATEIYEQSGQFQVEELLSMRHVLATTLFVEGDAREAIAVNEQILGIVQERPELAKTNPLFTRWDIGLAMVRLGRLEEAEAHFRELLAEAEQAYGVNAFFPWNIRWLLGHCRFGLGFEEEAQALYDAVLGVDEESLGPDTSWFRLRQAEHHAAGGRIEKARASLRAALDAGVKVRAGQLALLINPRLSQEVREELLLEIERR